jgi:hypothetical protein
MAAYFNWREDPYSKPSANGLPASEVVLLESGVSVRR